MALCQRDVTPVLTHWSFVSFALSHGCTRSHRPPLHADTEATHAHTGHSCMQTPEVAHAHTHTQAVHACKHHMHTHQGLYSLSNRMSSSQILWSLEAARLGLKFLHPSEICLGDRTTLKPIFCGFKILQDLLVRHLTASWIEIQASPPTQSSGIQQNLGHQSCTQLVSHHLDGVTATSVKSGCHIFKSTNNRISVQ